MGIINYFSRSYWEKRAKELPRNGYFCGRTDMYSYLIDGGYVHYVYPPNGGERIMFRGCPTSALRKAVQYAEKMNRKLKKDGE